MNIKFIKSDKLKEKNLTNLEFGKVKTDYMFTMDYIHGQGWVNPTIEPYSNIELDPISMVLHYAQETFEGLKAYKNEKGEVLLFRPDANAKRFIKSNERMSMPIVEEQDFLQAVKELVKIEKDWIPTGEGESLYIRPFMFATQSSLAVHASLSYKFVVVVCPVGAYYKSGFNPIKIYAEDEFVRAVKGGTGAAKCGGNYAGSLKAQEKATKLGYSQVLWLDGVHKKYVEEVGAMNLLFKINGEIYTAPIEGSVLPGITRDSVIKLLKDWGYKVHEENIDINDLFKYAREGKLEEAFGTGTAAVVTPVGEIYYKGEIITINNFNTGELTQRIYDELNNIQRGQKEDKFGWSIKVE